jgi:hypothetical protein
MKEKMKKLQEIKSGNRDNDEWASGGSEGSGRWKK